MGCGCKKTAQIQKALNGNNANGKKEKTLKFFQTTTQKILASILVVILLPIIFIMLIFSIFFKNGQLHIQMPKKLAQYIKKNKS